MSGGSFNYTFLKIGEFIEEVEERIRNNNVGDDYGHIDDFSEETIQSLKDCLEIIKISQRLTKHIEYLYSGDHGEETFKLLLEEEVL